ncbi:MAG: DUF3089 domain-containing protein [Bacteroidetes bacterium]|nr:DUF3089 domain-containing protein [Bacteroidota bacterium]
MKQLFTVLAGLIITANAFAQTVDYNLPENWMCHPVLLSTDIARQQNLTLTVKKPDLSIDTVINYTHYADSLVDIFYVYPTINMNTPMGNVDMDSIDTRTAQFVYSEQVGIYAQFGRVFVPYYRQAKLGVFLNTSISASAQLARANCIETAYNDIDSAFSNYLRYYNNGRKIILMGHSQGADHIMFLLRKKFDNNPVLQAQLVVALCAGEPNYASVNGSRTGGALQNIKECPPHDSIPECGCMMNWRTWSKHYKPEGIASCSFFFNPYFVSKGLIYQTYDTVNHSHQEAYFDFGYTTTQKPLARYISIDNSWTNYVGFDNMFRVEVTPVSTVPGSTHLLIDTIFTPNDQRKINSFPSYVPDPLHSGIPIDSSVSNYHIWDWQFVQNDVLRLLPAMIANCHPSGMPDANRRVNAALVYPNPTSGIVHVDNLSQKIISIKLYNLQGVFVREYFTNDFSVANQEPGAYFIIIQTDKSTYTNKLVKQ